MRTPFLYTAFLFIIFSSLQSCDKNKGPKIVIKECPEFSVEEGGISDTGSYEIIDAVVNAHFGDKSFVNVLVEAYQGSLGPNAEEMKSYLEYMGVSLEEETLITYIDKNNIISGWKNLFSKASLISKEEIDCFFKDNEYICESYEAKYPNGSGLLKFSQPIIYDTDKAIIEYDYTPCQGTRAEFIILEKIDGVWEILNSFTTIIS